MPFNRRLRTLCTLRSSFAATCGTSAPQGRERGHHTSVLNRRAPHARRAPSSFTPICGISATQEGRRGRAQNLGVQSSLTYLVYATLLFHDNLRHLSPAGVRMGQSTAPRCSIVGCRTLGAVPSSVKPLYGISAMRVRGRHGDFNYGFLWEAVSFCSTGMKRLAFIK